MPLDSSSEIDVRSFVSAYTPADEPRIRFAWNGKHAEDFDDANFEFREAVKEVVLSDVGATPIELVRDLFKAETECSLEAWGIGEGVDILAERLLRADPERFLEDYLTGKFQSFDAYCGSAFPADKALASKLLAIVRSRLTADLPEPRRQLLEKGEELFQQWL